MSRLLRDPLKRLLHEKREEITRNEECEGKIEALVKLFKERYCKTPEDKVSVMIQTHMLDQDVTLYLVHYREVA